MQKTARSRIAKKVILMLALAAYFAAAYAALDWLDTTCLFIKFFGFPCAGCGMTRAFFALLRFDILDAVRHNIVIFFMPYVFAYVFFDLRGRAHNIALASIGAIAVINWIIKLILYF